MTRNFSIGVLLSAAGSVTALAAPASSDLLPRATASSQAGSANAIERDGPTVFSQAPTSTDGFFSDAVSGQFYSQRIADNFALTSDTIITGVRWWGSSENFFGPPDLSNFESFTIEIFDGNFDSVYVETFLTSATNAAATGLFNSGGGAEFFQSVKFAQAVNLLGSTEYWLSIGTTNSDPEGDAWVWSGATGDAFIASDVFDGAGFSVFPDSGDSAFELQGVPTPGAASLLGLAGLAVLRRRR